MSVEAHMPNPLDPNCITVTTSIVTVLSSRLDGAVWWIEPGAEIFDRWQTVQGEMVASAGSQLLVPSLTRLPTSVRPDDPRSRHSLAA